MRKVAVGALLGLAVFALLGGASLSPEARRLAAVMACVVWWWMSESLPLPAAGLLASALCVVLEIGPAKKVMAPYADPIIFLFVGSFWLAESMSVHGLDKRLAVGLLSLKPINASPLRLVLGLGALAAAISLWVSNTATTAKLLPITLGILRELPEGSRSPKLEANLLLMLTFAASVGGLGTPVGTPPNLIGIGMLERLAGMHITFAGWCRMALPITGVTLVFLGFLLGRDLGHPKGWGQLREYLEREKQRLPKWSTGERNTATAFAVAVVLWLAAGEAIPEGISALLAASLLFILPVDSERATLTWKEAARVDWGTIFLFGSGMSLGQLLFDTKLAESLGTAVVGALGLSSVSAIAGLSSAMALLTSELASNTAAANVTVPVALALSQAAKVPPAFPALAATMASSFGFLLPVSTAPNALVYGTGKVPLRRMILYGFLLDLFGFFAVWLGLQAIY